MQASFRAASQFQPRFRLKHSLLTATTDHQVFHKPSKHLSFQTATAEALRYSDQKQDYQLPNTLLKFDRNVKDKRGYSHLKDEALDRTVWRNRFGRGFGPVVRQNTE
jgi:hypothetical protein